MAKAQEHIDENIIKQRVQRWVVIGGVLLMVGKFIAFLVTNSVGVLTDAMESIVNVTAGFISLYSLRLAAKPKDRLHPFGHGKAEMISASIEGAMIVSAGAIIIYEGVKRLITPHMPESLDVGIFIVAAAGLVNYIMGWYSIRVGRKYNSVALVAGGKHLQSDTYSTIGLVLGLVILWATGWMWVDGALALIFGSIIIITGLGILRKTMAGLMDRADEKLLRDMLQTINEHRQKDWIDIHNLKVIDYGGYFYIDCDLTMPWYYDLNKGHATCYALKTQILNHFSERDIVSVHSDPCLMENCSGCAIVDCKHRVHDFAGLQPITMDQMVENDDQRADRLGVDVSELMRSR